MSSRLYINGCARRWSHDFELRQYCQPSEHTEPPEQHTWSHHKYHRSSIFLNAMTPQSLLAVLPLLFFTSLTEAALALPRPITLPKPAPKVPSTRPSRLELIDTGLKGVEGLLSLCELLLQYLSTQQLTIAPSDRQSLNRNRHLHPRSSIHHRPPRRRVGDHPNTSRPRRRTHCSALLSPRPSRPQLLRRMVRRRLDVQQRRLLPLPRRVEDQGR